MRELKNIHEWGEAVPGGFGLGTDRAARMSVRPKLAFTLIELLTVIAIMGLLAGLIVGGAGLAKTKSTESRIRGEMEKLVTAIDDFKAHHGFYPPDNVVSRNPYIIVNPVTNQLFYELVGTIYFTSDNEFQTVKKDEIVRVNTIQRFFNTDGFVNAVKSTGNQAQDAKKLKNFLGALKPSQFAEVASGADDLEVLKVPVDWPRGWPTEQHPVPSKPGLNPWRYVSTNPTNNPGSFDLWAEFVIGNEVKVICNWRKDTALKKDVF